MSWRGGNFQRGEPEAEMEDLEVGISEATSNEILRPLGFENTGPSPPFLHLVKLFEAISATQSAPIGKRKPKGPPLEHFFTMWRENVGPDLYPALRLMLPDRDNRRKTYYLKEQKLAKAYIGALALSKDSDAAHALAHWKVPTKEEGTAGEFSSVAFAIIDQRCSVLTSTVTIEDVNNILDRISNARSNAGANGQGRGLGNEHAGIIKKCTQTMTALEQKWLIRIILRDLKVGLGERAVFNAMHADANEYFNTCSDLLRVSIKLYDPYYRLPKQDGVVRPGDAFRPMLCSRNERDLAGIVKSMTKLRKPDDPDKPMSAKEQEDPYRYAKDEFIIEEKLDGERIQLHKIGDTYHYWSRKAHNYTYLYGKDATPGSGSLTPFLAEALFPDICEVILDGEMLAYDPMTDKYIPFGTLKSFANLKTFGPMDTRPCFKVFDIVYVAGPSGSQCLLDVPLRERKRLLHRVFQSKKGVIELADMRKGRTTADISNYLKWVLESRGEGLVIKNPESRYVLSGREDTWIKVKPDYMDELGENIDAVVIGGYWGSGGRGGRHSSFMVGLRDEGKAKIDGEYQFVSFAKVGSGFNAAAYEWITKTTAGKWYSPDAKRFQTSKGQPRWFNTVNEYPDQYINPSGSFVVTIKAAEIVQGNDYGAGFTLRFPRATKFMDEEQYAQRDALTLEGCRALRGTGGKRKFGENLRGKKKLRTGSSLYHVEVLTDLFKGLTFYVHKLPNTALSTKENLEKLIYENGGTIIQRIPDEGTPRVVIASEYKERKGITMKRGSATTDVISPDWVLECIEDNELVPLAKRFYIRALPSTVESETYNFDDRFAPSRSPEVDLDEKDVVDPANAAPQAAAQDYRSDEEPATTDEEGGFAEIEPETEDDESFMMDDKPLAEEVAPVKSGVSQLTVEATTGMEVDPKSVTDAKPGLGAVAFDPTRLFAPFVCYFDTAENASLSRLPKSKKSQRVQDQADAALLEAQTLLMENGGEATANLLNPDLTHIIVHAEIPDRYELLIRKTTEPRYRKLVTHDWVEASVDHGESDVLDEHDYKP